MEREITIHQVPGELNTLLVVAIDKPGTGGANHIYDIIHITDEEAHNELATISFQNGGVDENGVNGITNEALLAIVIDRLTSFQVGPYPCDENSAALGYAQHPLHWLQERTRQRIAAQVEGREMAIPSEPLGNEIPEDAKSLADDELNDAVDDSAESLTDDERLAIEAGANKGTAGQTG